MKTLMKLFTSLVLMFSVMLAMPVIADDDDRERVRHSEPRVVHSISNNRSIVVGDRKYEVASYARIRLDGEPVNYHDLNVGDVVEITVKRSKTRQVPLITAIKIIGH